MKSAGLSIVIPVYNERDAIQSTIDEFREIKKSFDSDLEIIFVDDGSQDGTENILRGLDDKEMRVINHFVNRGYGAAIKTGIKVARNSWVGITDADGTYPNHLFKDLFLEAKKHDFDMVVGARIGSKVQIPIVRRPARWVLNKLANYLSGRKIPDLNSGLRIFRKPAVERFLKILPDGFSFTTTITLAMLTNDLSIDFIPIDYAKRHGKSKIRPMRDTIGFLILIIRTVLYFNPLKIFIPISAAFFLIGIAMIIYRVIFGSGFLVTSVVILVCGIQFLGLGMLADLIDRRLS